MPGSNRPEHLKWPGGYIRQGRKGRTYVIERWVDGQHFHVSTRCTSLGPAMKQLDRFEANPFGYSPKGERPRAAVTITSELVLEYTDWMENEKHNTREWCQQVGSQLADWIDDLEGRDLRSVKLHELKAALRPRKSKRHRVESIKGFCAWLRKEKGLLITAEDPTLDLPVPKATPAKLNKKRVIEPDRIRATLPFLPDATKDVLIFQSATAWHTTEVRRFAKAGEVTDSLEPGHLVVVSTIHKSKERHFTYLDFPEVVEAARRMRAKGNIPSQSTLYVRVRDACRKAGVAEFCLADIRHSVLTHGVLTGASVADASKFAGHKSQATTRNFYLDLQKPAASISAIRLVKP